MDKGLQEALRTTDPKKHIIHANQFDKPFIETIFSQAANGIPIRMALLTTIGEQWYG